MHEKTQIERQKLAKMLSNMHVFLSFGNEQTFGRLYSISDVQILFAVSYTSGTEQLRRENALK